MGFEIRATFRINGEIKKEAYLICSANSRNEAFAKALQYATGYGAEEHKKWDDPEVLERELISLEVLEN